MGEEVKELETMLFRSIMAEIKERFEDVKEIYKNDTEISRIAENLKMLSDLVYEVFQNIPDPSKNLTEDMYIPLYEALKDISSILYDLSVAEAEQITYVLTKAYKKIDNMGNLFESLK